MRFSDWLRYLESLANQGIKSSSTLDSVKDIAKRLKLLTFDSKVITIAGTNGKGSTAITLESILLEKGVTTATYLSPHLIRYNERIRLNGAAVSNGLLKKAFLTIQNEATDLALTYFDFSTLAALWIFKKNQPDYLILEVGLGGKLDPVNIIDPDLAIITSISLDHTEILGDSIEKIGYEKAGIIRKNKPVITGSDMPASTLKVAKQSNSPILSLNSDFFCFEVNNQIHWHDYQESLTNLPLPNLPLPSIAIAIMATKLLFGYLATNKTIIKKSLKKVSLPGRMESFKIGSKLIILDIAHNPKAAEFLATKLKIQYKQQFQIIIAVLENKDYQGILSALLPLAKSWYLPKLTVPRALDRKNLKHALTNLDNSQKIISCASVAVAIKQAIADCNKKDKLLVVGSCYTVAGALKFLYQRRKK